MVAFPSVSMAGVSTGPDMALVLASSSSPPPADEVVLEFDATHRCPSCPQHGRTKGPRQLLLGKCFR
jgi:hypothetical protein